jgi:hypothetical protein
VWAAWIIGAAWAGDAEVGHSRHIGLGIAAGFPPSVTLQWRPNPTHAAAVHVGPTLTTSGLHVRAQYEQRPRDLRAWDVARLALTWNIGLDVNLSFGQAGEAIPGRLGIHAGAGVELRLVPAPIVAFAELSPVFFPLDLLPQSNFSPVGINFAVGARFFLRGRDRTPGATSAPAPLDPAATLPEAVEPSLPP